MKTIGSILLLIAASVLTNCTTTAPAGHEAHEFKSAVAPQAAQERLQAGNERYANEQQGKQDDPSERRLRFAGDQKPFAVVLACADSRTPPEILFDQQLGDLFVCRVAGSVTDPVVLGSIEYALLHVSSHPSLIVVLGHTNCGAVKSALAGGPAPDNTTKLLRHVHVGDGLPSGKDAKLNAAVANNTAYQARSLTSNSKVIRDLVEEGKVRIVSGVYSLETGRVTLK